MMRDRKTERALIRGKDVERERPITATLVTGDSTFMRRSDSNDALRGLSTSYAGWQIYKITKIMREHALFQQRDINVPRSTILENHRMQLLKKLTQLLSFAGSIELAWKLIPFIAIAILSPSAYGENLAIKPCVNRLAISSMLQEVRARDKEAIGTPREHINVTDIVRKYIPVDCELPRIVIDLTNAGFKLSDSRKGVPSTVDASILLEKSWWDFTSVELLIEIQNELGRAKSLTGTIFFYSL